MQNSNKKTEDILKSPDITKIYLVYSNKGKREKYEVGVRYTDAKECYVAMPNLIHFEKPPKRIPVEITVFTPDGVYKTNSVLSDTEVAISEIMFIISTPQTWKYSQMRLNSRKLATISVKISFNDGFMIQSPSHNISLGGVSFFSDKRIPSIYTKLPCELTLTLPNLDPELFPNGEFVVTGRFVREMEHVDNYHPCEILYVFKFVGLSFIQEEILEYSLSKLK